MSDNHISLIDLPEVPDSVDTALKNLTDKPTKNIGTTLSDVWYLVFGGISHKADIRRLKYSAELEKYKAELDEAISTIPLEKKIEPSVQITAQALENSKYCVEEPELRSMFSTLIANSMNADYNQKIHPSFAEIIKQMSPLDAKVLRMFKHTNAAGLPLCNFRLVADNGGYYELSEKILLNTTLDNAIPYSQALSSLERLGLLSISSDVYLNNDAYYEKFKEHPLYAIYQKQFPSKRIDINKGKVAPTLLGRSFIEVCVPD
ncbi:MAG: DUF4393 domain-containing protein [Lachnospiraceae bacterium]|nr:DUF4393 domain-containing protein [Lachnospiraceae bacterium]